MTRSSIWNNIIILCVILNTITLAMEGMDTSEKVKEIRKQANLSFTYIFAVEMALKLIGEGVKGTYSSLRNCSIG